MPVRWSAAVAAARVLRDQCAWAGASATAGGDADSHRCHQWAVTLYALAVELAADPAEVTAGQLRAVLDPGYDEVAAWLYERLWQAGHRVAPSSPSSETERVEEDGAWPSLDVATVTRWLGVLREASSPTADDPPARVWRELSLITRSIEVTSEGTTMTGPPDSLLMTLRRDMMAALDTLLLHERGGWPVGHPVRTCGLPQIMTLDGRTAVEAGIWGDRGVITAPQWQLDDTGRDLQAGAPAGYWIRFRSRDDQSAGTVAAAPELWVPTDRLIEDSSSAGAEATRPPRDRRHLVAPQPMETPIATLRRGQTRLAARPETVVRRAALARLWRLRDRELRLVGDSIPRRRAERRAAGMLPPLPDPPTAAQLDELEEQEERDRRNPPWPTAPGVDLYRQLVTGRRRELLADWLAEVTSLHTTPRQTRVLDDLEDEPSLDAVRGLLLSEGFVELLDVHGNARSGRGDVQLLYAHWDLGMLAGVFAPDHRGRGARPQDIQVWGNVEVLDAGLVGGIGEGGILSDQHGRNSGIRTVMLHHRCTHGGRGSLRAQLAALRAFARPVIPWRSGCTVRLGRDSASPTNTRAMLSALPDEVLEFFGRKPVLDAI